MKKFSLLISVCIFTSLFVLASGCGKKVGKESMAGSSDIISAEKNSFKEVTSNLNPGGDFYLYLGTEKWLQGISTAVSNLRQMVLSAPNLSEEDRNNINKSFDFATHLIKNSGVEEISGIGCSSIAREKGLYHSKFMLHHYKEKNTGYLWSFFGKKPHPLHGLDFLPSSTAFASFFDVELSLIWPTIQQEISQIGIPAAKEFMRQLPGSFTQMTGITWDQFLASLDGEVGFIITLNEANKIPLPFQMTEMQEIPEPALMLVVKVKDDTLFNRVDQVFANNPQVARVDQDGLKMRTMSLPLPLPIQLRPTIARSGDYLFLASTDSLVREALEVKKGSKNGLKSSEEFKKLAQGVPQEGNSFCFLSQKLNRLVSELQKGASQMSMKGQPAQTQWIQQLIQSGQVSFGYAVSSNTEKGWLMVSNGSQDPSKALLISSAVLPIGMMAGIAVPSFVKARQKAQAAATAAVSSNEIATGSKP